MHGNVDYNNQKSRRIGDSIITVFQRSPIHHHSSPFITIHHHSSPFITFHHLSSPFIMPPAPTVPTESWKKSRCKAMLRQGIMNKTITKDTNKDALHASDPEYTKWNKTQFKRNLKALIKACNNPGRRKVKWFKSTAKELLRADIIDKKVTSLSDPAEVYQMHLEYSNFEFDNFKTNLKNLIEAVIRDFQRMSDDCEYFGHDLAYVEMLRVIEPLHRIPWHKSEAKPLLEADMNSQQHLTMKPKALYRSRLEYRAFTLEEFRKRINQEKDKIEKKERQEERKKNFSGRPPQDFKVDAVPF